MAKRTAKGVTKTEPKPETKPAPKSAADFKAALKKAATKPEPAPKKSNGLPDVVIPEDMEGDVRTLCELGVLTDRLASHLEQYKSVVGDKLFDIWTAMMWEQRNEPSNFHVPINKRTREGHITPFQDAVLTFQLKFRSDAIGKGQSKRVPDQLPDGKTVQDVLIESLVDSNGMVGMSLDNATNFVNNEVEIVEGYGLQKDLDWMLDQKPEDLWHIIGSKMMTYLTARPEDGEMVMVPAMTDEDFGMLIAAKQTVKLKKDLGKRVFLYCSSLPQLRKLLRFLGVTQQVSNFEFGKADEAKDKEERLKELIGRFIVKDLAEESD